MRAGAIETRALWSVIEAVGAVTIDDDDASSTLSVVLVVGDLRVLLAVVWASEVQRDSKGISGFQGSSSKVLLTVGAMYAVHTDLPQEVPKRLVQSNNKD